MSKGVNKVILLGNVGMDPESRQTQSGSVVNLRLATSEKWKDKQSGETQERTEWHKIVCYNVLAEIVTKYVKKGSKLYIEGSIRTNKWQDKEGKDQYTTEIIAKEVQLLDGRDASQKPTMDMGKTVGVEPDDLPF